MCEREESGVLSPRIAPVGCTHTAIIIIIIIIRSNSIAITNISFSIYQYQHRPPLQRLRKLYPEPQDSQALRCWFEASVFGWTPARQDARGAQLVKLSPTDNTFK